MWKKANLVNKNWYRSDKAFQQKWCKFCFENGLILVFKNTIQKSVEIIRSSLDGKKYNTSLINSIYREVLTLRKNSSGTIIFACKLLNCETSKLCGALKSQVPRAQQKLWEICLKLSVAPIGNFCVKSVSTLRKDYQHQLHYLCWQAFSLRLIWYLFWKIKLLKIMRSSLNMKDQHVEWGKLGFKTEKNWKRIWQSSCETLNVKSLVSFAYKQVCIGYCIRRGIWCFQSHSTTQSSQWLPYSFGRLQLRI